MIPVDVVTAAALLVHADRDRQPHPSRATSLHTPAALHGGVGRWYDSAIPAVWDGVPRHARDIWLCIRNHESRHSGHYAAQNPVSSASGAGQWIDSTWLGVAHWVRVGGAFVARPYSRARYAPAWVQDAAFVHVYRHGGLSMWRGTGCPGT